jgi:hypothetical protein
MPEAAQQMTALGHERKSRHFEMISALPLKADIEVYFANVG